MTYVKPEDNSKLDPLDLFLSSTIPQYPFKVEVYLDGFPDHCKKNYIEMLGLKHKKGNINDITYRSVTIMGEITNMRGHYLVVGQNGKVISGLHSDLFWVVTDSFE